MRQYLATILLFFILLISGCRSPFYADRGAAFGGVTGAGVGAVIAEAVDGEPLAGAAIGGVVGAITGDAIGREMDHQHQMETVPVPGLPIQEVVNMTAAGLSDDVIIAQLNNYGPLRAVSSSELIALKQQGVSDAVIRAMQTGSPTGTRPFVVAPQPVFVEPPVVPIYRRSVHVHGGRPARCGPRHGPHWGISFGGDL